MKDTAGNETNSEKLYPGPSLPRSPWEVAQPIATSENFTMGYLHVIPPDPTTKLEEIVNCLRELIEAIKDLKKDPGGPRKRKKLLKPENWKD